MQVVDIMRMNVDKVLERDQKLSELDNRADALQAGASQFETSAAKLKRKYWWKNCKVRNTNPFKEPIHGRYYFHYFNGTLLAAWHLQVVSSCQGKKEMPCSLGSRILSQATSILTRTYSLDSFCST